MLLTDLLIFNAQLHANKPALIMRLGYRITILTYAQVFEHARKIAQFLADQGVQHGDCVLLCAANSPWWACAWWACLLLGARVVPLAPENTLPMMQKILQQTEAKIFLRGLSIRHDLGITTIAVEHLPYLTAKTKPFDLTLVRNRPFDCAEIMYTSGTTGDPKGVMLTHENIMSTLQALQELLQLDGERERLLSILPLSHMFEQVIGLLLPMSAGAQVVYAHSHGAIRELLQEHHITKIIAVPEFLKLMAAHLHGAVEQKNCLSLFKKMLFCASRTTSMRLRRLLFYPLHRRLGGQLDTIASGGAPLDPDLEVFWDSLGIWIMQGYGLTETAPVVSTNVWHAHKLGSVGKPLKHVQVHIASDGEILIKGPNVFVGYFKNPEKTAESFSSDGFFKTGDMGYLDADGYLFLKGRKKYMILSPGGQNVFPEDIEQALNEHPAIKDSCVLGVVTAHDSVEIHAVVLLNNKAAPVDPVISEVNDKLASYQCITGWSIWPEDDFPRSVTRKIKRDTVLHTITSKQAAAHVAQPGEISVLMRLVAQVAGVSLQVVHPGLFLINDLKFDSLMRVELVTSIEETLHITIDESVIVATTTIKDLESLVRSPQVAKKLPLVAKWPRSWWARQIRRGLQGGLRIATRWLFKLRVEGEEHLAQVARPVIFMPNHVSLIDPLLVSAALPGVLSVDNAYAAGYDMLYEAYRWAAKFLELSYNAFPFPRQEGENVSAGLKNIGTLLDAGCSVTIFPEGKLSLDGSLQQLKKGAAMIGQVMQTPIIPVKIIGLEKLVPYDKLIPRKRGQVTVRFGKPIVLDPLIRQEEALAVLTRAMQDL
jgi:long-chain acyl-CoA synthetase